MAKSNLIQRMNNLEAWLAQSEPQKPPLPLRIGGYMLLFGTIMILNMGAMIRWPFAVLGRKLKPRKIPNRNTILEADRNNLGDLLAQDKLVLLDFWAEWCGPCIMMNEPLKQLAQADDVACTVVKFNTVTQPGLAKRYNVKGLPTLILCQQGEEIKRFAGALDYGELKKFVKER